MCGSVSLVVFGVLWPLLVNLTLAHHSRGRYHNVSVVVKPKGSQGRTITIFDANHLMSNLMLENIFCNADVKNEHIPVLYENAFNGLMSQHLLIESNLSDVRPYAFNNTILSVLSLRNNQLEEVRNHFFSNISVNSLNMGSNNIKYIEEGAFQEIARWGQVDPFRDNFCTDLDKYPPPDWATNWRYARGLKSSNFIILEGNRLEAVPAGIFNKLNVEYLILSENQIRVLESNSFSECSALKTLVLRDNQLNCIEKNVFKCSTLINLDLNGNSIESMEAGAFQELSSIRNIDLGLNKLKQLKTGVFNVSLNTLNLEGNEMTSIEEGAFEGLKVEELRLSGNSLGHISKGVFFNFSVISLFLGNNAITNVDPQAFADLPELFFLCLKDNKLTHIDKDMFHNVPNLKRIDLTGNELISTSQAATGGLPVFINNNTGCL